MIQAIIFDCFGVLATEGWLPFKEQHFGHNRELKAQATDLIKQANTGLITHQEFVAAVAKLARIDVSQVNQMLRRNIPNQPLFDYIKTLKYKYKIGFLSNSSSNWLDDIFEQQQIDLFDAIVLSYETGLAKPDPEIYRLAAQRLAVEPAQCVFIDDQDRYVEAAREIGMQGVWYQDFAQAKSDLEQILAK